MQRTIEQLTIMNDFLFGIVMRQEKFCKPLLEFILGVKIRKLVYHNEQETISAGVPNSKSIRLDVYVEDDAGTVYDLEVQTTDKRNLGKRTRYYQSMIDVRVLEHGEDYKKLRKSFIIFICNYDPFGKSQMIYTFKTRCDEAPDVLLGDEATKIIINTKGTLGNISDELKAVIKYMDSGITESEYTEELDREVAVVKNDEKVRREYMLLAEAYARERSMGAYARVVSQIRDALNELTVSTMAKYFKVSERDCEAVIECIKEHPDWDNEQIAEEIYWED